MKKANVTVAMLRLMTAMVLSAALAISLAGCGSSGGTSGETSGSSAPQASGGSPSAENPYAAAGVSDPAAFRQMFEDLKTAVAANDKEKVAEHALYPIRVNVGKVAVEVKTKEDFVKQYERIMTEKVRKALAAQDADTLFVNEEGVMAGKGDVWFGATAETPQRYGITTVNVGDSPRR
ncbi:hypothetical protein GE107_07625 [Cohnella sp. CFH 77786]|uniref:hypothetical protein n=1 Tax=Cohnella sp. CFH 77786 TaxID=2662265 RepID=UPI001C60B7E2|nr:hypothetical protein [Cohnella sp. CFH 77786]MBW5445927.1 hypothetical protein [Cohnella sp. CFH 77786]